MRNSFQSVISNGSFWAVYKRQWEVKWKPNIKIINSFLTLISQHFQTLSTSLWQRLFCETLYSLAFIICTFSLCLFFQENEDVRFPHRSTSFATSLQHLTLEYCDSITDLDMTDIVTVCRGSLAVIDYYSCDVTPNRLRLGKYKIKTSSNLDVTPSQEWKKNWFHTQSSGAWQI